METMPDVEPHQQPGSEEMVQAFEEDADSLGVVLDDATAAVVVGTGRGSGVVEVFSPAETGVISGKSLDVR